MEFLDKTDDEKNKEDWKAEFWYLKSFDPNFTRKDLIPYDKHFDRAVSVYEIKNLITKNSISTDKVKVIVKALRKHIAAKQTMKIDQEVINKRQKLIRA
jgi:hypothetical protein